MKKILRVATVVSVLCFSGLSPVTANEEGVSDRSHSLLVRSLTSNSTGVSVLRYNSDLSAWRLGLTWDVDSDVSGPEGMYISAGLSKLNFIRQGRLSPFWTYGGYFGLFTGDRSDFNENQFGAFVGVGATYDISDGLSLFARSRVLASLSPEFEIRSETDAIGLVFHF